MNFRPVSLLICCVFAVVVRGRAQTPPDIDRLLAQVKTAPTDTARAAVYLKLGNRYVTVDSAKADEYYRSALRIYRETGHPAGMARSYYLKGNIFMEFGKPDSAARYYKMVADIGDRAGDHRVAGMGYRGLSMAVRNATQDLPLALRYLKKSIDVAEAAHDDWNLAQSQLQLANLYNVMTDHRNAKSTFREALRTFTRLKDTAMMAQTLGSIGFAERTANHPDSAIRYLERALVLFKQKNNLLMQAIAHTEIGKTRMSQHRYREALPDLVEAKTIYGRLKNDRNIESLNTALGECYTRLGEHEAAIGSLDSGFRDALRKNNQPVALQTLLNLVDHYRAAGDFRAALAAQQRYNDMHDSITGKQQVDLLARLSARYDAEKKAARIAGLSRENARQKLVIARRNAAIGIIAAVIAVAASLIYLVYARRKLRQRALHQQELSRQRQLASQAVLQAEESERKRIAGDLHDGIGQLFSTVKLNLSAIEDHIDFKDSATRESFAKTVLLVDQSCAEVRSISHQMAPNALLRAGLVSAVRDFITLIDERRLKVNLEVAGVNERLDSNVEVVVYRVIQEAVNNVIKHAAASFLDIQLTRDGNGLAIMVEDDGVGFDPAAVSAGGLGLRNMTSRIAYLDGSVDVDSSPGKGTVISIWIPLAANAVIA